LSAINSEWGDDRRAGLLATRHDLPVSNTENGSAPTTPSAAFNELLGILGDPHRHQVARIGRASSSPSLGPTIARKRSG
jgi:hypothetical protein